MTGTIDADAREFGNHARQGGWRLGVLVARSVDPSGKGGRPRKDETSDRSEVKVSMAEFARRADIDDHTVRRYYDAWEAAANAGCVKHAADLVPGEEIDLTADPEDWEGWYQGWNWPRDDETADDETAGDRWTIPLTVDQIRAAILTEARAYAVNYWAGVEASPSSQRRGDLLRLRASWREFNDRHFGGQLVLPQIEISDLGKSKDGEYDLRDGIRVDARTVHGFPAPADRWGATEDTLLHEMVHQYVAEVLDDPGAYHGRPFRERANAIGATLSVPPVGRGTGRDTGPWPPRPVGFHGPDRHCPTCEEHGGSSCAGPPVDDSTAAID